MSFSNIYENKVLDAVFNNVALQQDGGWIGLSTTTPAEDGSNITEPSGGSYARVAASSAVWTAAANGSLNNASTISFPQATADWSGGTNQTHYVMFTASSAGDMITYGALTTARNVLNGDQIQFPAGQLTFNLD